ncbi:MAG: FtsX-like permease family protein [Evtepia gabavorous]
MYIKLALRNLRRSARDYGIYFLTVAVTVALMESFLALACARDVLSLSENMGILTTGIVGVSVLVALLSSCVIAYGVGFMLGQRKQEFALYQLMGMELRTIQRMFFWENGLLGLAAFGLGALLGTGLAGVLAQGVWWIFQTPHQYQVVASPKALGMTFLLFLLMYGVGALRAGRVLRRQSIQGLLTSRRANEVPGRWRPGRWFLLVAPALTGMALGLLLLRKALDMQTNGPGPIWPVAAVCCWGAFTHFTGGCPVCCWQRPAGGPRSSTAGDVCSTWGRWGRGWPRRDGCWR